MHNPNKFSGQIHWDQCIFFCIIRIFALSEIIFTCYWIWSMWNFTVHPWWIFYLLVPRNVISPTPRPLEIPVNSDLLMQGILAKPEKNPSWRIVKKMKIQSETHNQQIHIYKYRCISRIRDWHATFQHIISFMLL